MLHNTLGGHDHGSPGVLAYASRSVPATQIGIFPNQLATHYSGMVPLHHLTSGACGGSCYADHQSLGMQPPPWESYTMGTAAIPAKTLPFGDLSLPLGDQ